MKLGKWRMLSRLLQIVFRLLKIYLKYGTRVAVELLKDEI